jgi:hypothetical protein
VMSIA